MANKKQQTGHHGPNLLLRQARETLGWTQEELAERVGASALTVGRWERGEALPGPHFRRLLSGVFQQSSELLGLSHSSPGATVGQHEGVSPSAKRWEPLFAGLPVAASPVSGLIGREDDLRRVKDMMVRVALPASFALTGLPGVGKTALATALAYDAELRQRFPDGVLWAGVGPKPNVMSLLGGWGVALGMTADALAHATSVEGLGRAIRAVMGERRLLLVIDDAWRLEDALALAIGGPLCAHLVTSRFPALGWQFAPYGAYQTPELCATAGAALLAALAPGAITHNEAGQAEARELVCAVGGLPLALTLMGSYLHTQAQSGQPRRLRAALASLRQAEERLRLARPYPPVETPPGVAVGSAQSLQAALAMSVAALSPAARLALHALAYLPAKPNSFTEEVALALSDATQETLDELVDAGMLESVGAGRYTLHQTVHDYAQLTSAVETTSDAASERTTPVAALAVIARRAVTYYVAYTEAHEHDYALLELEADNIMLAIHGARQQGMALIAARGEIAFAAYRIARGRYATAEAALNAEILALRDVAETPAGEQNSDDTRGLAGLRARAELGLARIALRYGRYAAAEEACLRGLTHLAEIGAASAVGDDGRTAERDSLISSFYVCLGESAMSAGDHTRAEKSLKRALAHAGHDTRRLGEIYRLLGEVADSMGHYAQGDALYRQGLSWARRARDSETICMLLQNLGGKAIVRGECAAGEALLDEGLALAQAHGLRQRTSALLNNLGRAAQCQGRGDDAERLFLESLELARAIGHPARMILALENLAELLGERGEFIRANGYARECLRLAREIDQPFMIGDSLCAMGELRLKQARSAWYADPESPRRLAPLIAEAIADFEEAREIGEAICGHNIVVNAAYRLACIAAAQGRLTEAMRYAAICQAHLNAENSAYSQDITDWLAALRSVAPLLASDTPLPGFAVEFVFARQAAFAIGSADAPVEQPR